eukprot:3082195-Amphidinium_carterae.1
MKRTNLFSFTRVGPIALASEEDKHSLRLSEAKRLGTDFPQPKSKKVGRPKRQDMFRDAVVKALIDNNFEVAQLTSLQPHPAWRPGGPLV